MALDLAREFVVPDAFADLCVDADDDDARARDGRRRIVIARDASLDVASCDPSERADAVDDVVRLLCDGEAETLVNDLNAFGGAYALCRCAERRNTMRRVGRFQRALIPGRAKRARASARRNDEGVVGD